MGTDYDVNASHPDSNAELMPAFEDYPVSRFSSAAVERVVPTFLSPVDEMFLERKIGSSANYAGKYVLTYWGCGTACQRIAAINVETGAVLYPGEGAASSGVCFERHSRLLIVNPVVREPDDEIPDWFYTYFYEITDEGFRLLGKTRAGLANPCGLE
ncbi:hypothetical protein [Marinobacter pelagius]|uniref:Uncharacterized protein n=1 Tax=Marinobacter pelagius TaxID=379482 RepID=A0A1I4XFD7_9GAMM|nr:hypothetical protein [Marinobacter pelagius]SFN24628.1 hypothetical protein SAMN04487961_2563 [Marinobacter pelagius]